MSHLKPLMSAIDMMLQVAVTIPRGTRQDFLVAAAGAIDQAVSLRAEIARQQHETTPVRIVSNGVVESLFELTAQNFVARDAHGLLREALLQLAHALQGRTFRSDCGVLRIDQDALVLDVVECDDLPRITYDNPGFVRAVGL